MLARLIYPRKGTWTHSQLFRHAVHGPVGFAEFAQKVPDVELGQDSLLSTT